MGSLPPSDSPPQDARSLRLHVVPSGLLPELADQVDALGRRIGAPFTASREWLAATCSAVDAHEPWAVVVRDHVGALCAAVVLLEQPGEGHQVVTLAGAHLGFQGSILATDGQSAALLGYGLRRQLQYRAEPTVGILGPVASDTVGLAEFCANLSEAELTVVDPIPLIQRREWTGAGDYLSASMRRTLRKARNRLSTDRRTAVVTFTDRTDQIGPAIPALHRLHVRRDHSRGLSSALDDPADSAIWTRRLLAVAQCSALELAMLHIDGDLASYALSVRDGTTLNVLEGVLDPDWSRYAPGRLLETALLQRMLDDPTLSTLDWTSPVAPESLLATNASKSISVVTTTSVPVIARDRRAPSLPAPRERRDDLSRSQVPSRAASTS